VSVEGTFLVRAVVYVRLKHDIIDDLTTLSARLNEEIMLIVSNKKSLKHKTLVLRKAPEKQSLKLKYLLQEVRIAYFFVIIM